MKVGIHLGGVQGGHEVRGIGVHTSELLRSLQRIAKSEKGIEIEPYTLNAKRYDLIHYTVFKPFALSIPLKKKASKVVLTIHDLIPLIYPEHYPAGIKGRLVFLLQKYLINKNVDAVVTISETSKKDICRFLGVDPEKVHVIYLAPKGVFKALGTRQKVLAKQKYHLPESFALYVGDVNYNKNIPGLIEACKFTNIPLVIVGKQAKNIENQDLGHPELRHLKGLDWSNVIRPGYIPDNDLAAIYNLADVYIQPSLYEGFSLSPLEAKACGTWVIATKIQAHVEILDSKRDYSWEKTAKETIMVYEKVNGEQ